MLSHVLYYGLVVAAKAGESMGADPVIVTCLQWARRGFAVWRGIETAKDLASGQPESADLADSAPRSDAGGISFGD
jgi:hypothetical protein